MDPIVGQLMGLRYKSHPWHGVNIGDDAPENITCFIEIVSTDTVKYEVDKESGYLFIDRPQKYSNTVPALYGFLPQSYSGDLVAQMSNDALQRNDIHGDAFAPRNPQALKIDFMRQPPYFDVSPTHRAKTWLLDARAPKVEPPAAVRRLRAGRPR